MAASSRDMSLSLHKSIIFSPVSILDTLKRRKKQSDRGRKRKMSSRIRPNEESSDGLLHVSVNYEASSKPLPTTNWVDVMFIKSSNGRTDLYSVPGGRKGSVTINPEWRPPTPPPKLSTSSIEACSPKRLLPTSIIKYTDYCEDDISSSEEEDAEIESSLSPAPASPEVTPPIEVVQQLTKRGNEEREKSIMPLLMTPQSPLATCNIKSLLIPDKLLSLPAVVKAQILQLLPQCDRDSILMNEHKAIETALSNEYVSAAVREWQDHLALGLLHGSKIAQHIDHAPSWKENVLMETWEHVNGNTHPLETRGTSYDHMQLTSDQQCVYNGIFTPSVPTAVTTPTPHPPRGSSLPVHLPRHHYNAVSHTRKQILSEHSYFNAHSHANPRFPLVLKTRCMCLNSPLRMCTMCHKFYHGSCSQGNSICQYCVRRRALDTT